MPISNRRRPTYYAVYENRSPWAGPITLIAALVVAVGIANGGLSSSSSTTGGESSPRPSATTAVVRPRDGLDLRVLPDPQARPVTRLPGGAEVELLCHTTGPEVTGEAGTSATWVRVRSGDAAGFVPDVRLRTAGEVTALVGPCA